MNYRDIYLEAINELISKGKKVPELYDLLIRGQIRGQKDLNKVNSFWSDLDFTFIVHKLTQQNLNNIKRLYRRLNKKYPFKISLTYVTKKDFSSSLHHHGIKPLYYTNTLNNSSSIYNEIKPRTIQKEKILKYDCFNNLTYLIHNLRLENLKVSNKEKDINNYLKHLIRRSKHVARNSIYILTGQVSNEINEKALLEKFGKTGEEFISLYREIKNNWSLYVDDRNKTKKIINKMLIINDKMYNITQDFVDKMLNQRDV